MQPLLDFLSFKTFITPGVLLFCYYLGALGGPLGGGLFVVWLRPKYRNLRASGYSPQGEEPSLLLRWTAGGNGLLALVVFLLMLLCMEIMWRMMFEFMLAYFQMREALLGLSQ